MAYTQEQIYDAMRAADRAGDAAAVRRLAAELRRMEGGQQRTAQPKPPSRLRQLGDATVNTVAGLAQGALAIPDTLQSGGNALMRIGNNVKRGGGAMLLDAIGADRAASGLRQEQGVFDRMYSQQAQRTAGNAIERMAPTPQDTAGKVARFTAQIAGGAMIPLGQKPAPRPQMPRPAPQQASTLADDAERAGVRLLRSDVKPPRTFVGKTAQATGERIIGTGTGGLRQAQQAERIAAVRSLADDFGVVDDGAGLVDDVMADLAKTRGGQLQRLTGAKNSVIDGIDGVVPVDRTVTAIDQQIARLKGLKLPEMNTVVSKLEGWKAAIQGQNLRNIEDIRKSMGKAFSAPELAGVADEGQKAVNAIYAPLRAEMGTFISNRAGPAGFSKWKGANDQLAAMAGELKDKSFVRVMNNAEVTPENVATMLFSKKASQVRRLYANLSGPGRAKAQTAIIARAIDKAGGIDQISPERFTGEVGRLGKSIGVFFQGDELARLEGLNRVLQATRRASEAALAPPTGVQTAMAGVYGGAGVVGGIPGLLAVQGYGLLARVYENTGVRTALLRLGKTKAGSPAEAALMQRAMTGISSVIAANRDKIANVANDPVGIPLAADEGLTGTVTDDGTSPGYGEEYQQEQQPAF